MVSEAVVVALITGVLSLVGVGLIVLLLMFIIRDLCRWRQDAKDRKEREELKKYE